jgi:hypothetical protein
VIKELRILIEILRKEKEPKLVLKKRGVLKGSKVMSDS